MSLLLEALKKAEAAKQQGSSGQPGDGLTLEPSGIAPAAEQRARPVMTRDRLPDITQPLEILSDDLPSAAQSRAEPPPLPSANTASAQRAAPRDLAGSLEPTARPQARMPVEPASDGARDAARQLFEAKTVDYDPYRFIKLVVGLAVGVVVVYGGYLYYQLQPPTSMAVATSPQAPQPTATPAPAPVPAPPAQVAVAPVSPPPVSAPAAIAPAPAPAAPAPAPAPAPMAIAVEPPAAKPVPLAPQPRVAGAAPRAVPRAAAPAGRDTRTDAPIAGGARATVTPATNLRESSVERAYAALEAGDLPTARQEYLRTLAAAPLNRDALLGLASVDMQTQNYPAAEQRYLKVLEIDPRDAYAQAGMINLRGLADPVQSESRVKSLLASQPDALFLNFVLGNTYAAQSRWADAQQAYFKAYSTDPDNADYAFNLAVSLDHLRQPKLALEYYQRALALAANHPAGFSRAQVESRIRELSR